jgi:2-keto-4-pentenoate hydratase/2-oxohepta-3-ene-1,7-dioic acid hydratase in catechol pathway
LKRVRIAIDGVPVDGSLEGDRVVVAGADYPVDSVQFLAPCTPTKIVCVGRNYSEHVKEMRSELPTEPLIFLKPPSAIVAHRDEIAYPRQSSRVDFEGELAVVIGRRCRDVRRADALSVVLGFAAFNDVTARDLQKTDGQWARAKGFDTFAPLGPCIVDGLDPSRLRLRTYLNGAVCQDASTESMIFDVPALIEYISAAFTLEPGDVVATGTPSGVGPMRPGDEVRVEIDGIGSLVNRVVRR